MGCDIHIFPEYQVDGGAWQSHPDISIEVEGKGTPDEYTYISYDSGVYRDYELFAALAGVRGRGPAAKGIPTSISPLVAQVLEQWDCDAHSHSFMSLKAFQKILEKNNYETEDMEMFKSCERLTMELSQIDQILLDCSKGSEIKWRVVFFFDN